MDNKEIFQRLLRILEIGSDDKIPKQWSEFFPSNLPRTIRNNKNPFNIFKEKNRDNLLSMISAVLGVDNYDDCFKMSQTIYLTKRFNRRNFAFKFMSLIVEMSYDKYDDKNFDWIGEIEDSDIALEVYFWTVLHPDIENKLNSELQLCLLQFIYDYYMMLFSVLYKDKDGTLDHSRLARDCFVSVMTCQYYSDGLLKPIKAIIREELKKEELYSTGYIHLLNTSKRFRISNPVYAPNFENCFYGYNDDDFPFGEYDELTEKEAVLLDFFTHGIPFTKYCAHFSKLQREQDNHDQFIKDCISNKRLLAYTELPQNPFREKLTKCGVSYFNKYYALWNALYQKQNRQHLENVFLECMGYDYSETNFGKILYDLWEKGAVSLITNPRENIIRHYNDIEYALRHIAGYIAGLLKRSTSFDEFMDLVNNGEVLLESRTLFGMIYAMMASDEIKIYTAYNKETFSERLETISFESIFEHTGDNLIKGILVNEIWSFLDHGVLFRDFHDNFSQKLNMPDDIPTMAFLVISTMWINGIVFFKPFSISDDDYEKTCIGYKLLMSEGFDINLTFEYSQNNEDDCSIADSRNSMSRILPLHLNSALIMTRSCFSSNPIIY